MFLLFLVVGLGSFALADWKENFDLWAKTVLKDTNLETNQEKADEINRRAFQESIGSDRSNSYFTFVFEHGLVDQGSKWDVLLPPNNEHVITSDRSLTSAFTAIGLRVNMGVSTRAKPTWSHVLFNLHMIDPHFDSEDKCEKAEYLTSLWDASIDMEKFKSEFVLSVCDATRGNDDLDQIGFAVFTSKIDEIKPYYHLDSKEWRPFCWSECCTTFSLVEPV